MKITYCLGVVLPDTNGIPYPEGCFLVLPFDTVLWVHIRVN